MNRSPEKKDAKAIFSAAIEYYMPHQWEAYIVDACGDDETLRQRVRELLSAHQQSDSLLDREPEVTEGTPVTERPGTQIGHYKLLQEIGEGGFGVVYMAEQIEPVRRKVALKIIKPGMDTKQVIARFEAERQALAMMDHPNIAKVLDAGSTESGRPYFVMELVKGVPITEFCDTNKLPNRDRLALFTTVCRAIQHAHQKGVIHRDLKPSNVMVTLHDNKPMPVVIDFGVSKAISHQLTEKTLFTAYGQMVGTPAYMSPEQAQMSRMDIDTRSDIYSLGVMLYELLTGGTPLSADELRGTAYAELQRKIREEEAPKPSTRLSTLGKALAKIAQDRNTDPKRLGQFLRGDLDWIVLKALEKERNRRYETANGLANDIERFLSDEAVEACPPTVAYQVRKFVSRNRGLVTTASAIAAAVLLGIIGTTYGMIQARREADQARYALRQADIARDLAKTAAEQEQEKAEQARKLQLEADQLRADAEAQVAQQLATRAGMERIKGDVTLAALLDAEALARDQGNPERAANHRRRLAADLQQCPRPTHLFLHDSAVTDARFSQDGRWIVTGCEDGTVRVWDAATGKEQQRIAHDASIAQVTFVNDDTNLLVVVSPSRTTPDGDSPARQYLWNWKSGRSLESNASYHSASNRLVAYPDQAGRTTYIDRPASNEIQLRSIDDGAPLGELLRFDERQLEEVYGTGGMGVILVSSHTSNAVAPRRGGFGGFGEGGLGALRGRFANREFQAELWDAATGARKELFNSTQTASTAGQSGRSGSHPGYSDDKSLFAFQFGRGNARIYDTSTGEEITSVQGASIPRQFSPGNTVLACQTNNSPIVLVDVASGEPLEYTIPAKSFGSFSPSGSRILAINEQGHPQLWYTSTGRTASAPLEHEAEVQKVGFSPDGRYVRAVCIDGTVRVWDGLSGQPAAPLLKHIGAVTSSHFSRDGSHLMVVAGETVWLWPIGWPKFDQLSIALGGQQTGGRTIPTSASVISPDGKKILTGTVTQGSLGELGESRARGQDVLGEMRVWDSANGQLLHGPVEIEMGTPLGFRVATPVFSADCDRILIPDPGRETFRSGSGTSGGEEPNPPRAAKAICTIWNLRDNKLTRLNFPENDPTRQVDEALFSSDGQRILTILSERTQRQTQQRGPHPQPIPKLAIVWDAQTGNPIGVPIECNSSQQRFSPDGLRFAFGETDDEERGLVHVINTIDGSPAVAAIQHQDQIRSLTFCQDGKLLLTVTQSGVASFWEPERGQRRFGPIAFSSDVAPRSRTTLRCAVSPSAEKLAVFSSIRPARTGLFGTVGRGANSLLRPLTISLMSPTVAIYGLLSKSRTLLQHEQGVTDASFSPDSQHLMTTSTDNVIRVWDSASGQLIRTLRPAIGTSTLLSAAFSNDGQRIVTRAGGAVRVWEVATGQPLSPTLRTSSGRESPFFARSTNWNASADRILIRTDDQLIVHDLSPEQREVEQLQQMTQVLSGRRVNSLGNVEALSSDQFRQQWRASMEDLRDGLIAPPQGVEWHRLQLGDTQNRHASVSNWHLDQLIAAEPNDVEARSQRGRLLAERGQHVAALIDFDQAIAWGDEYLRLDRANSLAQLERWEEAAEQLKQVIEKPSAESTRDAWIGFSLLNRALGGDPDSWANAQELLTQYALGIANLMAGNHQAYEQCCQWLLEDSNLDRSASLSPQLLTLILLTPRSEEECDLIQQRLDSRPREADPEGRAGFGRFGSFLGNTRQVELLLSFRREDYQRTLELLPQQGERGSLVSTPVAAMVRHQLGEVDQAGRLLDQSEDKNSDNNNRGRQIVTSIISRSLRQTWCDAAVGKLLRHEAEQMINNSVSADPSATDEE